MHEYGKSDLLTVDEIYMTIDQMFKNIGCHNQMNRVDFLDRLFLRHDIFWGGSYEHNLDSCLIKLYQKSGADCLDDFSNFIEIELTFL
jgi:hypothetical protein